MHRVVAREDRRPRRGDIDAGKVIEQKPRGLSRQFGHVQIVPPPRSFGEIPVRAFAPAIYLYFCLPLDQVGKFWVVEFTRPSD